MDTAQWPEEIVVKPFEEIVTNTCPKPGAVERKAGPEKDQALGCPRCNSTNTKFCYYNNYSLTQPRYFCKTCRRYWTEGGSLRNIPVGGGSRKNKRSSTSSASSSKRVLPDQSTTSPSTATPNPKIQDGQDLNLAFPSSQGIRSFSELIQVPSSIQNNKNQSQISSSSSTCPTSPSQLSALELISGISSRGLNPFMPMPLHQDPNGSYETGFPLQDFKPTLNFSLDGLGGVYGSLQGVQETNNGRLLFPFEEMKQQVSSTGAPGLEQNKENGDSTGYWTGMLGGDSW